MRTLEGKFNGKGLRIGIVAGRFNEFITSKLVGGAVDVLKRNDVILIMFVRKFLKEWLKFRCKQDCL